MWRQNIEGGIRDEPFRSEAAESDATLLAQKQRTVKDLLREIVTIDGFTVVVTATTGLRKMWFPHSAHLRP